MSDDGGQRSAPTPRSDERFIEPSTQSITERDAQFTVPIPIAAAAPATPLPTQVLPPAEPTRQFALSWSSQPGATRAAPVAPATTAPAMGPMAPLAPSTTVDDADPLLAKIGVALFWITVGWWLTVVVRGLGSLVRQGSSSTLLIENIDRWPEETVVAAVISVLAALVLLLGRGQRGRDALGWSSAVLALVTVGVAIWRLLP